MTDDRSLTRRTLICAATAAPAAVLLGSGPAQAGGRHPETIALPDGWRPEGIAIGGHHAYVGSLADGSVYRADLRTGEGRVHVDGPGTGVVGLHLDRRGRLFGAGGATGEGRVFDAATGRTLATYALAASTATFVNDVVVTPWAAYFTDSVSPFFYELPFGPHGRLPAPERVRRVPITGDFVYDTGFNANGITTTPDGRALLIVQSNKGLLYRVGRDGLSRTVDTGGSGLTMGDGLLRDGRTLYAIRNRANEVLVLRLDHSGNEADLLRTITDERFDVLTTAARHRDRIYFVNARFDTPPTPQTTYNVVAVDR
ncbi:superoxide dismutase [Phytomonospora sp. NPDC050363]|uniref:superoxide dismutase n=1 Tax=Phytomonospora sp. NPDC050363 TaxID=3155642 RepID=UPI0033C5E299